MENIHIPVSPGEVLDKITILEIKSERMTDEDKLTNIRTELQLLQRVWASEVNEDDDLKGLRNALRDVNETLWDIEDDIRDKERDKAFDEQFIDLARKVYFTNDRRSEIKKAINQHLGSVIMEEKSYRDYS
jgi:hypothetical protein